MTALMCAACSLAEILPTLAPLPPGLTGPILPPAYVPEPEAILASVPAGERPARRVAPPAAREAAQPARGPDGSLGGG